MSYPYSVNKNINPDRLTLEIQQSGIVPGFYITGGGERYTIFFNAELSPAEHVIIESLLANHVPIPLVPEEDVLKTVDRRFIVKPNVRPLHTSGYFTARDDNPASPKDIGNGNNFVELHHKVGDPLIQTISQRFNVEGNRTWIYEGYLTHIAADFDRFCFYISAMPTPFTPSDNTNFMLTSKGLIVPVKGNGNVSLDLDNLTTLVSVVPRTDTGSYPAAMWNADFDFNTGKYMNLTPAPLGDGKYNIFGVEVPLKRYINSVCLIGDTHPKFETSDPSELGSNMLCNYRFTTKEPDHEWKVSVYLSMFREKVT